MFELNVDDLCNQTRIAGESERRYIDMGLDSQQLNKNGDICGQLNIDHYTGEQLDIDHYIREAEIRYPC